jgi:hypothetical protein
MRQIPQFAGPLATLFNIMTTLYYLEPATWVDPQISPFQTTIYFETDCRSDVGLCAMAAALVSRSLSLFLFPSLSSHTDIHSCLWRGGGGRKRQEGRPKASRLVLSAMITGV